MRLHSNIWDQHSKPLGPTVPIHPQYAWPKKGITFKTLQLEPSQGVGSWGGQDSVVNRIH